MGRLFWSGLLLMVLVSGLGSTLVHMRSTGPAPEGRYEGLGRFVFRTRLFVVSYAAVLAIFALESRSWWGRVAFAVATLLAVVDGIRLTYGQQRKAGFPVAVTAIKDKGGEVSGYLASYILPFLVGPPSDGWRAGAYGIYFAVAWVVYTNSDLVLINPTLYILRWRVIQGSRDSGTEILVLSRHPPVEGVEFDAVRFGSAYIHKEVGGSGGGLPPQRRRSNGR